MMEVSKIQLSKAEMELMQNEQVILTKNSVLKKMKALLECVQEEQAVFTGLHAAGEEIFSVSPKISKGENYLGLPYLILDYPRKSHEGIFFIRTMFWWGRYFSSTLHLSASYKTKYLPRILGSGNLLSGFYLGIHPDPWIHHFESDNYLPLDTLAGEERGMLMKQGEHLKLGIPLPLDRWKEAPEMLFQNWKLLLECCGLVANAV